MQYACHVKANTLVTFN